MALLPVTIDRRRLCCRVRRGIVSLAAAAPLHLLATWIKALLILFLLRLHTFCVQRVVTLVEALAVGLAIATIVELRHIGLRV